MKNKIKVITPFYNPGEFLDNCVASLISQKHENFQVIFIDDCSTDGSFDKLPKDDNRVKIIKNTIRKTALENIHNAIINHCDPDDIVIIVDGDDWLPNKKTLNFIDNIFFEKDCWIMYGQASWTDGRRGFASAYSKEEFLNIRKSPFRVSHIRCWRAGLYQKIQDQDPNFSCMKDLENEFYKMTYDVAIMFPLLELAGYEKTLFNDEILYIYNRNNPISDDKVNQNLQTSIHMEISEKQKFTQILDYK